MGRAHCAQVSARTSLGLYRGSLGSVRKMSYLTFRLFTMWLQPPIQLEFTGSLKKISLQDCQLMSLQRWRRCFGHEWTIWEIAYWTYMRQELRLLSLIEYHRHCQWLINTWKICIQTQRRTFRISVGSRRLKNQVAMPPYSSSLTIVAKTSNGCIERERPLNRMAFST